MTAQSSLRPDDHIAFGVSARPVPFYKVFKGFIVSPVLYSWIHIGSNAYAEYTFVPWLGRSIYRRTVDLSAICIQ